MPDQPLAEVFGYPINNQTPIAERSRKNKLCPFNNISPNCTKSSVEHPIGVCSAFDSKSEPIIICPVRFRQDWSIATDAASFFFPPETTWTAITEVRLNDRDGKSAGNIDVILLAYDELGRITEYGALEVQAVYISGNISKPFRHYMELPTERQTMSWRGQRDYPRPDYLSSSRKRLAPQLIFKGGILNAWGRKTAVALDCNFFQTLPALEEVDKQEADIAWFVYELIPHPTENRYILTLKKTVYTKFEASLLRITRSEAGEEKLFIDRLQAQLDRKPKGARSESAVVIPDDL